MAKKYFIALAALLCAGSSAFSQGIIIQKRDGSKLQISSSEIDFIQVCEDEDITYDVFTETNFKLAGYPVKSINPNGNIILIQMPFSEDRTSLVADFNIAESSTVYANGIRQESGITPNDFSMPVEYTVETADGTQHTYTVAICFSDMPVLYMNTNNTPIASKDTYVENISMLMVNSWFDGSYSGAKIKGRGNSSWEMPKKSYTMKLNKKDTFAGLKKHKTFALVANYADKTLFRNHISYELGREVFTNLKWSPSTQFCQFILNGEYLGVYDITETVKIDANRVNIPTLEDCKDVAQAANYGFIVEVNTRLDEAFNFTTSRGVDFSLKEPDGADISDDLCQYIKAKTQEYEDSLFSATADIEDYFDINSFIDWFLSNEIAKNADALFNSSCYIYFDPSDQKLHMGPIWDYDIGYGNINYGDNMASPEGWYVKNASWLIPMFENKTFVERLKARWDEVYPSLKAYDDRIDDLGVALDEDAVINFQRWPILGEYVWPNADGYENRTSYQSEVVYLRNFYSQRIDWINQNIRDL